MNLEKYQSLEVKHIPDIDIDVPDRNIILDNLNHRKASIIKNGTIQQHNVGVYFQDIPIDPITKLSSIDYEDAESRGYFKIDILNLNLYKEIKSEEELNSLMKEEVLWDLLQYKEIVEKLFQIGSHYEIVKKFNIQSIDDLAIVNALIRPSKKYLIGYDKEYIKEHIWKKESSGIYFKKSHSYAYAHVISLQLNMIKKGMII